MPISSTGRHYTIENDAPGYWVTFPPDVQDDAWHVYYYRDDCQWPQCQATGLSQVEAIAAARQSWAYRQL